MRPLKRGRKHHRQTRPGVASLRTPPRALAVWRRVCPGLMKKYPGGVLAVHVETGDWYAGGDSAVALLQALRKHPEGGIELLSIDEHYTCRMK